jgi:hypothetical protein
VRTQPQRRSSAPAPRAPQPPAQQQFTPQPRAQQQQPGFLPSLR